MRLIVEKSGHIRIPQEFLDELGIKPGEMVNVSLADKGMLIQSVNVNLSLRGMFVGSGMLDMLMQDRMTISR